MATWDDVRDNAMALPDVTEREIRGNLAWLVRDKVFVWQRPLRAADVAALGDAAPTGPILAARVADEGVKHALIADDPVSYFTTPHFDGYAAVLVRLAQIPDDDLMELIVDAWLNRAPKKLAAAFLKG